MKYRTFNEFLSEKHMDGYTGTDDNAPDAFDSWLTDLQVDDIIEYADEWSNEIKLRTIELAIEQTKETLDNKFQKHEKLLRNIKRL